MGRPLLFYSAWPLGYHNPNAERKALALVAAGYRVTYVPGIGIRNPGMSNLPKLADRARRGLRAATRRGVDRGAERDAREQGGPLRGGALLVLPPRQFDAVRALNVAWVRRQLRAMLGPWPETVAWLRWPTPEVIDALAALRPRGLVYEVFDAHEATPGITDRWRPILERYERRLVAMADRVVVPGEQLAGRYRAWGAEVSVVPHGVELSEWHGRPARPRTPIVIGFVGTIDVRLSVPILRAVASSHPEWRIRLIGPVQDGFDRAALRDLSNVSIEPAIDADRVPETVGGFDLGIMPYVENPNTRHMVPVKNLEYLAAGIPAVARRIPALEPFGEFVYFADEPEQFVAQLERALADDTPELAEARRRVAEEHGWPKRLAEIVAIADAVGAPRGR